MSSMERAVVFSAGEILATRKALRTRVKQLQASMRSTEERASAGLPIQRTQYERNREELDALAMVLENLGDAAASITKHLTGKVLAGRS